MSPAAANSNGNHLDIPKEGYAQIFKKNNDKIEYKKVPVQGPGPDEVLVNIKYSGVCHTDLHAWKGDWPLDTKENLIGGHEGAGVVVARGELVKDVEIGDHVGVKWINGTCLACDFCQQSDEPLCAKATMSGYTVDGTFAQYCIAKANHVARIPKEIDLAGISPILCAGITVYKALKETGARPGQTVAITGAGGGLGAFACQYAKAMGLQVIAVDTGDEKKNMLKNELGVEHFVDFATTKDIVKEIKGLTADGTGPHAVVLVAVSSKPFEQATEYVRPRGTVVCVGLPPGATVKADVFATVVHMVNIKGSYVGNRRDTAEAIEFYRRGQVKAPFKIMGLSELPKVYEMMEQGKIAGRIVLDTSK